MCVDVTGGALADRHSLVERSTGGRIFVDGRAQMSQAPIDIDRAAEIAKRAAADRGRSWVEPTQISEHGAELHVSHNAEFLCGNILLGTHRVTSQVPRLEEDRR